MARPLRILVEDGWYHVMARGNRRQTVFGDDKDRRRFLGLVSELPERFRVEIHAFTLMDNHYHLEGQWGQIHTFDIAGIDGELPGVAV